MPAITFKEHQEALVAALHKKAVWEYIYDHLENEYIPRDGMEVQKGIRVPGMLHEMVSEDAIEEVLANLTEGPIKELTTLIEELENSEVIMEKDDAKH